MTLHTLTHFLDRFVYRTPKAAASTRGSSLMQPLAGSDATATGTMFDSTRPASTAPGHR